MVRIAFAVTMMAALSGTLPVGAAHAAAPLPVVAAENFYGDVAAQLGGANLSVMSILSNPDEDPHLFEASASTARAIARARIVIVNGIDYDPWMAKLLSASHPHGREVIDVAKLMRRKEGDNPHLWYDPAAMPAFARAFAAMLIRIDPDHRADYQGNLDRFLTSLAPLESKVAALKQKFAGTPVTATEPVFGYMASALGLVMRNQAFQLAIMNDTEPSASAIAGFESDLRGHAVRLLLYNSQTSDKLTLRMRSLAQEARVPVVGVSETEPAGNRYQDWMLAELAAVDEALSGGAP